MWRLNEMPSWTVSGCLYVQYCANVNVKTCIRLLLQCIKNKQEKNFLLIIVFYQHIIITLSHFTKMLYCIFVLIITWSMIFTDAFYLQNIISFVWHNIDFMSSFLPLIIPFVTLTTYQWLHWRHHTVFSSIHLGRLGCNARVHSQNQWACQAQT